jgi:tetratricopeptide (TPR) repeat protein
LATDGMNKAKVFARVVFLLAALVYLAEVMVHGFAAWLLDSRQPRQVELAAKLDPGNPAVWTARGDYLLFSERGLQPEKAVEAYLRAAALNPLDVRNWNGLAEAYFQLHEPRKMEAALRAAVFASPHSPTAAWRLANFLLLTERTAEAFPYLRVVAQSSRRLRPAVFDMAWKATEDPGLVFNQVVPRDAECLGDYLRFLMARRKLGEGEPVWAALRAPGSVEAQQSGSEYAGALAAAGQGEAAGRIWGQVLADSRREAARRAGNFVNNGDFELDMPNAGLDWRFQQQPGYEISIDNLVAQQGTRSLRITFDGSANLEFGGVWQLAPLRPNRQYRFRAYMKLENVTTDQGIVFCISPVAAPRAEQFLACTENRVGTEPWMPRQLDFRTGPGTSVVLVQARRRQSQRLDNLVRGKIWIDDAVIEPAGQE